MLAFGPIAAAPLADDVGVRASELAVDAGSFALTGFDLPALSRSGNVIADGGWF